MQLSQAELDCYQGDLGKTSEKKRKKFFRPLLERGGGGLGHSEKSPSRETDFFCKSFEMLPKGGGRGSRLIQKDFLKKKLDFFGISCQKGGGG